MQSTQRNYQKGETIAAIATPPGVGGIAVIRISGERALDVANQIFSGPIHTYQTHTAHFGNILDAKGNTIDEGMVLVMKNPQSYTGEDTVEIHCHGGPSSLGKCSTRRSKREPTRPFPESSPLRPFKMERSISHGPKRSNR